MKYAPAQADDYRGCTAWRNIERKLDRMMECATELPRSHGVAREGID